MTNIEKILAKANADGANIKKETIKKEINSIDTPKEEKVVVKATVAPATPTLTPKVVVQKAVALTPLKRNVVKSTQNKNTEKSLTIKEVNVNDKKTFTTITSIIDKFLLINKDVTKISFRDMYNLGIDFSENDLVSTIGFGSGSGVSYMSWSVVQLVMKLIYGKEFRKLDIYNDGTNESECFPFAQVSEDGYGFIEGGYELFKEKYKCSRPILSPSNKAIDKPNSFVINYSYQRAVVKAIAENTGFGLHLWTENK